MSLTRSVLQIFLSSPGDVGAQREIARETINQVAGDPLASQALALEVVAWDNPGARVPLSANQTPQVSVNEFIRKPRECDLTIVLLWGRLGTPLPKDVGNLDGRLRGSGTLWELSDALAGGRPVWIYRKTTVPTAEITDVDLSQKQRQLREVDEFLATARNPDGSLKFGVNHFADDEELRTLLGEHLRHFIRKLLAASPKPTTGLLTDLASVASHVVLDVVDAASMQYAVDDDRPEISRLELLPLAKYPIGPMIKDVEVRHLSEAVAEMRHADDLRTIFAEINAALSTAKASGDPSLRLSLVHFSTTHGSKHFWENVLHHAAVQGPRMLSAVLATVDPARLEAEAGYEFQRIVRRVNSYV